MPPACARVPLLGAELLARDAELGFERIFLHNLGRNQEAFIEAFAARVLPALR